MDTGYKGHVFKIWETVGNGMLIKKKRLLLYLYTIVLSFFIPHYISDMKRNVPVKMRRKDLLIIV
jgi:hypothetical protein